MASEGERQHFRLADTRSVVEMERDEIWLPTGLPDNAIAILPAQQHALQASKLERMKRTLSRCISEEFAYRQNFLFVPVFLGGGAALWFSLAYTPSYLLLAFAAAALIALAIMLRYRSGAVAYIIKSLALLALGMVIAGWESQRADTIILDTPVTTTVTGKVERREVDARGYWRYIVELKSTTDPVITRPPSRASLLTRSKHDAVAIGQTITGRVRISPPSGPALPGLNDFAFATFFNGVGATGFFYGAPKLLPAESERETQSILNMLDTWLYQLRSSIAERIRSVIGGDAGAFAASIITDERRAISSETMEALRVSGLAHIVAISGLNMALASGIFFVGMRMAFSLFPGFSQRWPVKKISAFAALLMTLCYYLISGFAVSAERAWLMMSIMLIAVLVDQPSISLRNVALSAIVIITLSPHEVMGPSFQMSFAATLALVAGYAFWTRWRADRDRFFMARPPLWMSIASKAGTIIGGVVITSLIGGISTAIYSIEHFHRVTTYGLAANLAAMPVMSMIVMPFALIAMLLMPFGLDAPFLKIMGYGMAVVIDIAKTVAGWGGDATIGRQNEWFLLLSTIGFLILTLLRTRLALLGLPMIVAGFSLLIAEQWRTKPDLLIYEDGSLVALVSSEAVATTKPRASGFVYEQWARALPLPEKHIAPEFLEKALREGEDDEDAVAARPPSLTDVQIAKAREEISEAFSRTGSFTCRKDAWCAAKSRTGATIAVLSNSGLTGTACDIADIVVTSRFVPFRSCRSGAILISRETLRRTGSLEIWLNHNNGGVEKAISAIESAARPWSEHRTYNWRDKNFDGVLPQHIEDMLAR